MSYEILYAKKFIRLSNNTFIPLVLSGSNNCTTFVNGREVRERHWWVLGGLVKKTEEEICEWARGCMSSSYSVEWFKNGSSWITGDDIFSFIKNSTQRASTIEEILKANPCVSLSVHLSIYDSTKNFGEKGYRIDTPVRFPRTTPELEEWIEESIEREKSLEKNKQLYYKIEFSELKHLKSASVAKSITGPVFCCPQKGYYLIKYDIEHSSYTYGKNPSEAIVFESIEEFNKSGVGEIIHSYKLVKAEIKPKNFVVVVCGGFHSGCYVQKLTAHRVYFTNYVDDARRFKGETEAQNYINKKLIGRFNAAKEFCVKNVSCLD